MCPSFYLGALRAATGKWTGLDAGRRQDADSMVGRYSAEALALLEIEGARVEYPPRAWDPPGPDAFLELGFMFE
jgi:hypothetical protein